MSDPMQRRTDSPGPLFAPPAPPPPDPNTEAVQVSARYSRERYRQILAHLAKNDAALWEVAAAIGVEPHRISGRFTELAKDGLIERTGQRKPDPTSGCPAHVWRIRSMPAESNPNKTVET